jgi:hypothetical protein
MNVSAGLHLSFQGLCVWFGLISIRHLSKACSGDNAEHSHPHGTSFPDRSIMPGARGLP